MSYFLRCRMRLRMRRFLRPTFRRPFPRRRLAIRSPGRFELGDEGSLSTPDPARRFGKTAILLGAVTFLKRRMGPILRIPGPGATFETRIEPPAVNGWAREKKHPFQPDPNAPPMRAGCVWSFSLAQVFMAGKGKLFEAGAI